MDHIRSLPKEVQKTHPKMNENPSRAEAERLIGIAEKLLQTRDLAGTKDFAVLAQETEPLLDGPDQILAVADVLLSSEKRVNNHHDWYAILQLGRRTDDPDLIKKQYRRLALLLHPDKNKYPFADQAFKLVADAWAVLSDSSKKALYDNELTMFARVDLSNSAKLPVRRSQRPNAKKQGGDSAKSKGNRSNSSNVNSGRDARVNNLYREQMSQRSKVPSFWTACPYCYILYEYPRVYEECCLKCQNCGRAFHAALLRSLPPLVPGKEAYYCCWGFFPLGFVLDEEGGEKNGEAGAAAGATSGFPNWMPPIFSPDQQVGSGENGGVAAEVPVANKSSGNVAASVPPPARMGVESTSTPPARMRVESTDRVVGSSGGRGRGGSVTGSGPKKRGRPRKYPVPT